MVEVSLFLFGKPEMEIDTEKAKPEDIKELGNELQARLKRISVIVEKLEKNGWERSGGLYDINFYKKISEEEAKAELKKLDIKEDEVSIMDFEEEELEEEGFEKDEEK